VANLQQHGFTVYVITDDERTRTQAKFRRAKRARACHAARLGKYTIESHLPAESIRRLMREQPTIAGLSVPGMPIGSPGVEQGDRHDGYAVLAFDAKGRVGRPVPRAHVLSEGADCRSARAGDNSETFAV
jgi:hypothetical protein